MRLAWLNPVEGGADGLQVVWVPELVVGVGHGGEAVPPVEVPHRGRAAVHLRVLPRAHENAGLAALAAAAVSGRVHRVGVVGGPRPRPQRRRCLITRRIELLSRNSCGAIYGFSPTSAICLGEAIQIGSSLGGERRTPPHGADRRRDGWRWCGGRGRLGWPSVQVSAVSATASARVPKLRWIRFHRVNRERDKRSPRRNS